MPEGTYRLYVAYLPFAEDHREYKFPAFPAELQVPARGPPATAQRAAAHGRVHSRDGRVYSSTAMCTVVRPCTAAHKRALQLAFTAVFTAAPSRPAGRLQPDKGQLECADRLIAAMDLETEERGKPGPAESNNPALQVNRLDNDTRCKGRPTQRPPCMAVHSAAHSAAHSAVQLLFTLGTGTCTAVVSMKTLPERARVSLLT